MCSGLPSAPEPKFFIPVYSVSFPILRPPFLVLRALLFKSHPTEN